MTRDEFLSLTLRNPVNAAIADVLMRLALPDAWLVSGCLVQTVWNVPDRIARWITASPTTTCSISIRIFRGKPRTR